MSSNTQPNQYNPIFSAFPNLTQSFLQILKSIAQSQLISGTTLYRSIIETNPSLNISNPTNLSSNTQDITDSSSTILNSYTNILKSLLETSLNIPINSISHFLLSDKPFVTHTTWVAKSSNYTILIVTGSELMKDSYPTDLDEALPELPSNTIYHLSSLYIVNIPLLTELSVSTNQDHSKSAKLALDFLATIEYESTLQQTALAEINELYPYISQYLDELDGDVSLYTEYFNTYLTSLDPQPSPITSQIPTYEVNNTYPSISSLLNTYPCLNCIEHNIQSKYLLIKSKQPNSDTYLGITAYFKYLSDHIPEDEITALATYVSARVNYVANIYTKSDPHQYKPRLHPSSVLYEYIILTEGYTLEPQITSYCDNPTLLAESLKSKLQEPEVEELMYALRTGYAFSEWKFPNYLSTHNFYNPMNEDNDYLTSIAAELLSFLLNLPLIQYGSRRIVFDLGDSVLKLWYRTSTQQDIEVQFVKEKPNLYTRTIHINKDFIIAGKCLTLEDLEEGYTANISLPHLYSLVSKHLPGYESYDDPDDIYDDIADYIRSQLNKTKSTLAAENYNTSDLTATNVGLDPITGEFKILDAGYIYKLDNPPKLRGLDSVTHFNLYNKNYKSGTPFHTIEMEPSESGKYIVKNYSGDRIASFRAFAIHEYAEVSDACLSIALKELEDEYKSSHNITEITYPYPTIKPEEILERASMVPCNYETVPIILATREDSGIIYTCSEYDFNEDNFRELFKIYAKTDNANPTPPPLRQSPLQTKLSTSYCGDSSNPSFMKYDLEEYLLSLGVICVSREQFYADYLSPEEDINDYDYASINESVSDDQYSSIRRF